MLYNGCLKAFPSTSSILRSTSAFQIEFEFWYLVRGISVTIWEKPYSHYLGLFSIVHLLKPIMFIARLEDFYPGRNNYIFIK